jgi:hypothetical protein
MDRLKIDQNNDDLLLNCVRKITYMNLLKDAGEQSFNKKYFWEFFKNKMDNRNRENTKDLIQALDPDIFIITASEGIKLIEQLFNKKFEDHIFVYNKTLFVALGHPSRCFTNDYIIYAVNMINNSLKIQNKR